MSPSFDTESDRGSRSGNVRTKGALARPVIPVSGPPDAPASDSTCGAHPVSATIAPAVDAAEATALRLSEHPISIASQSFARGRNRQPKAPLGTSGHRSVPGRLSVAALETSDERVADVVRLEAVGEEPGVLHARVAFDVGDHARQACVRREIVLLADLVVAGVAAAVARALAARRCRSSFFRRGIGLCTPRRRRRPSVASARRDPPPPGRRTKRWSGRGPLRRGASADPIGCVIGCSSA